MAEDLESILAKLDAEPEYEIDYDAPESGSFPPEVYPGRHTFLFKLDPEQPFTTIPIEGREYLNVNAIHVIPTVEKPEGVEVRFQRASFYKHPKMGNSDGGDLLRCLGIKAEANSARAIVTALRQADGRARGEAVYGWEAFSKDTQEIISTNPRSKPRKKSGRSDLPWPKGADGKYQLVVKFPESGDSVYGRVRVVSYKLPDGSAQ